MTENVTVHFDPSSLSDAINWASHTMDQRDPSNFFKLSVSSDGNASISFQDHYSYTTSPIEVKSPPSEDIDIPLNALFLNRLASPISSSLSDVILEKGEENGVETIELKTSTGHFKVPVMSSRILKLPNYKTVGTVQGSEFFEALPRLSDICDNSPVIPALGSVDLKFSDDSIILRATDSYAFSEVKVGFTPSDDMPETLLNSSVLFSKASAKSVKSNGQTDVDIIFDESTGKIGYQFTDGRVLMFSPSSAQPASLANLKKVSKAAVTGSFKVGLDELRSAISTILSVAWSEESTRWTIEGSELSVHDSKNENQISIPVMDSSLDETVSVVIPQDVMGKAFKPMNTSTAQISLAEDMIILEPVTDNGQVNEDIFSLAREGSDD